MLRTFLPLILSLFLFSRNAGGFVSYLANASLSHHDSLPELQPGVPCSPGQLYREACNTCKCSNSHQLICTRMACLKHQMFEQLLHPKNSRKSPAQRERRQLYKAEKLMETSCTPGKMYKRDCNTCFCTEKNYMFCTVVLCTGKITSRRISTIDVIPVLDDKQFIALQNLPHQSSQCQPGHTYRVNCNTCLCAFNGNLICTQMLCKSFLVDEVAAALRQAGEPCKDNEKFESKCLNCECHNSTFRCKAIPGCDPEFLRSKTTKFSRECKSKIQCDLTLDPEIEKCTPGEIYLQDCNKCACQEDFSLRCTQKKCLSYVESEQLNKQRLLLLQNSN